MARLLTRTRARALRPLQLADCPLTVQEIADQSGLTTRCVYKRLIECRGACWCEIVGKVAQRLLARGHKGSYTWQLTPSGTRLDLALASVALTRREAAAGRSPAGLVHVVEPVGLDLQQTMFAIVRAGHSRATPKAARES